MWWRINLVWCQSSQHSCIISPTLRLMIRFHFLITIECQNSPSSPGKMPYLSSNTSADSWSSVEMLLESTLSRFVCSHFHCLARPLRGSPHCHPTPYSHGPIWRSSSTSTSSQEYMRWSSQTWRRSCRGMMNLLWTISRCLGTLGAGALAYLLVIAS